MPKELQLNEAKRVACLECRLNKIRCSPGIGQSCQRCEKHDFICTREKARAGRKAKSKVETRRAETLDRQAPPLIPKKASEIDANRCSLAFVQLIRNAKGKGSTYTFVAAGEADVSPSSNIDQLQSPTKPVPSATLSQLLRPYNAIESSRHAAPNQLPKLLDLSLPRHPVQCELITADRAACLYDYFNRHLSPWLAVLDPLQISNASPFLSSAILMQASRYIEDGRDATESDQLTQHVRRLAMIAFAEGDTSSETLLAFYLTAIWKSPQDAISDLYIGYADRIALMQQQEIPSRQSQRIDYFHFVQQNVFLLHYSPTSALIKRDDLDRSCHAWALQPEGLIGDWFLCSDVESTAIQCKYKILFEEERKFKYASSSSSLLEAFLIEVQHFEDRWKEVAKRKEDSSIDNRGYLMRMAGLNLFRNSIQFQISSVALSQALQRHVSSSTNQKGQSTPLQRSYEACLDSAMGIMHAILGLEQDPLLLLHMPDSLVVLAAHASLLIVYLLLVPFTSTSSSASISSNSVEAHGMDGVIAQISQDAFGSCLATMQKVHHLMQTAASARIQFENAITLCRDYIGSLVEILRGCLQSQDDNQAPSVSSDVNMLEATFDGQAGWDWLEAFLSNTSGL